MDMEGPLPPGIKGCMVGTTVAGVGLPLVGSIPAAVCAVVMGPLEGIPVMISGKDIGPLPTIPLWKGSGCALAMGLVGAVNKVGLDW